MEQMSERERWLESLTVGDEVAFETKYSGWRIEKIEKITPKRTITTTSNYVFKKGMCKVDNWTTFYLTPVDGEIVEETYRV